MYELAQIIYIFTRQDIIILFIMYCKLNGRTLEGKSIMESP